MNFRDVKETLKAEARKLRTRVKIALLIALPFAAEIKSTVAANLPALQPYLPENIYKFMGGAVVVASIVLSFATTHRLLKAGNESDNA